jgi:phosphohistidine phosphatase
MKIYFLRHGIAYEKEDWAPRDDRKRPLTDEGKKKVRRIAKGLRRLDPGLDVILTSPWERALKTAEITAKLLKLKKHLEILPDLASDGDPEKVMERLAQHEKDWESVMLVGHEPYLSRLVAHLTTSSGKGRLLLKKGGLILVTSQHPHYGPCAQLEWLLPPKVLEKLR